MVIKSGIFGYEQILTQDSVNLSAILSLADCQYREGDADTALNYWILADSISPDNLFIQTRKTVAHFHTNNWYETLRSAEEVFRSDTVPLLLRICGDASMHLLRIDSAQFFYAKAIEKNPDDHLAVNKLANLYYSARLYPEAIAVTENYLENINPNRLTVGQLNGMALYSNGDYEKAIERLNINTQLGDSTYSTSYFLGMSYYASRLYIFAVPWLEKAYTTDNNDINLLYYYGTALSRTYDRKRGMKILREGVDKIEQQMEMLYDFDLSFANAHLGSSEYLKAVEYFKSALEKRPDKSNLLYNIANVYDMSKNYKNALDYYQRFVKTKPVEMDLNIPFDPDTKRDTNDITTFYLMSVRRIKELEELIFFESGRKQ